MKNTKIWASIGLVVAAILAWGLVTNGEGASTSYRFVTVSRGNVESVVTATGALEATETVEVGTQVSGQIAELLADYNDHVEAGQLLARIDPTILQQEVSSAEASLARSQAELDQAARELARSEELHAKQVVTDAEHDQAVYAHAIAKSGYASAEISLQRARRNLEYTEIRAPNDGVVVQRAIDVGQTVAASLSAPTLFIIAQDLAEMEILASVDESDIGQIHEGQEARFTVRAYPDREFIGTVRQVRLQSTTSENVVNYSVVVGVDNEDGVLLPGMTATVDFVVERAENVLIVPNTALRFQATEAMRAQVTPGRPEAGRAAGAAPEADAAPEAGAAPAADAEARGARGQGERGQGAPSGDAASGAGAPTLLWYLDADGQLAVVPVRTGLNNGSSTEIITDSPAIVEGLQVIAAVVSGSASGTTASNPFQSNASNQSGGPGPRAAF